MTRQANETSLAQPSFSNVRVSTFTFGSGLHQIRARILGLEGRIVASEETEEKGKKETSSPGDFVISARESEMYHTVGNPTLATRA